MSLKCVLYENISIDITYDMSLEWHSKEKKNSNKMGKKENKFCRNNIEHATFWVIEWWSEWWFVGLFYNSFSFSRTFQDFERRGSMGYEFLFCVKYIFNELANEIAFYCCSVLCVRGNRQSVIFFFKKDVRFVRMKLRKNSRKIFR